jgi:2-polyprenyl-6-methoxyphenol hydroxylase-like FAD-dependent oxidoreductase
VRKDVDVIVVGARCAGSPLAMQLARGGLSVTVVDRAAFPSDTLSTHVFQAEGVSTLQRLGVLDRVLATGAPWLRRARARFEDVELDTPWAVRPEDAGPMLCVRRPALDTILVEAAQEAGADVRTGARVAGLLGSGDQVEGVRIVQDGDEAELRARIVVGADGVGSTVGRLVGARKYNVTANERFFLWGYFEPGPAAELDTIFLQRWAEEFVLACPIDAGAYLLATAPPLDRLDAARADLGAALESEVRRCPALAPVLDGARPIGPPRLMPSFSGYFRESVGPGWALVGDAGHFKDPSPGQGISDAFRRADRLASTLVAGLGGTQDLQSALRSWWRWRDRDAAEAYWFAQDMGRAGPVPPVFIEMIRGMAARPGGIQEFMDVFNHRRRPSQVLSPPRLGAATVRLLRAGRQPRGQLLRGSGRLVADDLTRRYRNRRPVYAA